MGPTPNLTPPLGVAEKELENVLACWPSPSPGPMETGHCLGQEAQGPEPPAKWSFPEGKRKDRTTLHQIFSSFTQRMYRIFSVVLNRMCPFRVFPCPLALPDRAGGLALIPPTPSLGRVQRKAWVWAFCSLYLSSPFEGWARPF